MTQGLFAPRALRELRAAAVHIAKENPSAAERLLLDAITAARRLVANPTLARTETRFAPPRFRFWSLRPFHYLLVVDTEPHPPVITRFVHQARDLPVLLRDL